MKSIKNVIVYWHPETKAIMVGPFPELPGTFESEWYSWGGCNAEVSQWKSRDALIGRLFTEIHHWIIRDGIAPADIHRALWGIKEYRDGLASDVPAPK
jgi:hypothetical protein